MKKILWAYSLYFAGISIALPPAVYAGQDALCEMSKGYENNMVVYGTVRIQGYQDIKEPVLLAKGASGKGVCLGESAIRENGAFYLTIVGNKMGETISFVVVDPETESILPVGDTLRFQPDATMAEVELW